MAAITDLLIAAGAVFAIAAVATWLFPHAEYDGGKMNAKMVFRFLLAPLCLAVMILLLDGEVDHLYWVKWLQP